jgi:paraquat-inducible protein B
MEQAKRITLILTLLSVGCPTATEEPTGGAKPAETAASKLEDAKRESAEAGRAVRDYAYAERAEFIAEMNKELATIEAEMDRLTAKVESSEGEVKADAKLKLDGVRQKWAEAKKRLDDVEKATADDWDEVKRDVERSHGELKKAFDDTRQWLSEEIAPS